MTTDDPWAPSQTPSLPPPGDYESALEAAGYGATQRQRYIDEAADPEFAECQWDEMVLPGAEAAGLIPPRPVDEQVDPDESKAIRYTHPKMEETP